MSIITCPSCGETYVSSAEVCADCGVPLLDPASAPTVVRLEPGTEDEVGYDLDDWDPDQRGELVAALAAQGIAHRWEDGELVVRERDANEVEPIIDEVDHPDALEVEDDDDDAAAELLSAMYVAADVVARDAANPGAVFDLVDAESEAAELDAPYGVPTELWSEIKARLSTLTLLLDHADDEDTVRQAAKELRDLLHPLV